MINTHIAWAEYPYLPAHCHHLHLLQIQAALIPHVLLIQGVRWWWALGIWKWLHQMKGVVGLGVAQSCLVPLDVLKNLQWPCTEMTVLFVWCCCHPKALLLG